MNFIRSFLMIFYPNRKKLLQYTFLYDAPDEGYPESLRDFMMRLLAASQHFSMTCLATVFM